MSFDNRDIEMARRLSLPCPRCGGGRPPDDNPYFDWCPECRDPTPEQMHRLHYGICSTLNDTYFPHGTTRGELRPHIQMDCCKKFVVTHRALLAEPEDEYDPAVSVPV